MSIRPSIYTQLSHRPSHRRLHRNTYRVGDARNQVFAPFGYDGPPFIPQHSTIELIAGPESSVFLQRIQIGRHSFNVDSFLCLDEDPDEPNVRRAQSAQPSPAPVARPSTAAPPPFRSLSRHAKDPSQQVIPSAAKRSRDTSEATDEINLFEDQQKRPSGRYMPKSAFALDPVRFVDSLFPPVVGRPE